VDTGGHLGGAVFAAADVHYLPSGGARATAVMAADTAFSRLAGDRIAVMPDVAPYQPGQFCLRELPPLHAVLDGLPGLSLLVIDGYADLDPDGLPGLGARAREQFGVPVIGVAKTPFRTATTPSRSCAEPQPGRCTLPPPGYPGPTRPTSSGIWPTATGCPTPRAGPAPWPATASLSRRVVPDGCTVSGQMVPITARAIT
jgi:hypothetical protein